MKKFLIGAAIIAISATSAQAQPFDSLADFRASKTNDVVSAAGDSDIDFDITGFIAQECALSAFGVEGSTQDRLGNIDLSTRGIGDLLGAGNASIDAICNFGGGATITISSTNNGEMVNPAGGSIGYTLAVTGGSGWANFDGADLSGGPVSNTVVLPAPNTVQTGGFNVRLTEVATVAGTYTDTITVAIAPN